MDTNIQSFKDFFVERIRPCIFCVADDISVEQSISNLWPEIIASLPIKIRLIFPNHPIDVLSVPSKIYQSQCDLPPLPSCAFFNKSNTDSLELSGIKLLRQGLIESHFLPFYFFPDCPLAILSVSKSNLVHKVNLSLIPKWAHPYISKCKTAILRINGSDFKSSLFKWLENYINSSYQKNIKLIEEEYKKNWTGFKKAFSSFLDITTHLSPSLIALKQYADIKLQQSDFISSVHLYKNLIDNIPPNHSEFFCEVSNLYTISQYLNHELNTYSHKILQEAYFLGRNP